MEVKSDAGRGGAVEGQPEMGGREGEHGIGASSEASSSSGQSAARMPRSRAFEGISQEVALARLQELKEDALQAWSGTF